MALANYVREQMSFAMGNRQAADEVCDLIDTDGVGTLSRRTKYVLRSTFANAADGNDFITTVEAGSGLSGHQTALLGVALCSRQAAALIQAEKLTKTRSVSDTVTLTESTSAVRT